MNLGFYVDSQQQTETTNKIYNTLNTFVESKKVDNVSLFYNDIDFNPIQPKFGCFNSTDIWYFTGNLVITAIKNALAIGKVINKFKPFFLYDSEKGSPLEMIAISAKMPILVTNEEDAKYIKRSTGANATILPDGNVENIVEVLNE